MPHRKKTAEHHEEHGDLGHEARIAALETEVRELKKLMDLKVLVPHVGKIHAFHS